MNRFNRFSETQLPPKNGFFNRLDDAHVSDGQYEHARRVWTEFQCDTLMDYHDVFLKSDVLLLADFERFWCVCMSDYGLDPLHYYTTPGLAWDAALKMSRVNQELITDIDIYNFIEQSIHGGISMISNRYAANLPDIVKELRTHLIYLDANNLYGWAMSQYLPTHGFKFLTDEEVRSRFPACDINTYLVSISDTADTGYILEVDLEYPSTLHDSHNDYPLAVESLEISRDMFAPLQQENFQLNHHKLS